LIHRRQRVVSIGPRRSDAQCQVYLGWNSHANTDRAGWEHGGHELRLSATFVVLFRRRSRPVRWRLTELLRDAGEIGDLEHLSPRLGVDTSCQKMLAGNRG
jgi:hypothetical protein